MSAQDDADRRLVARMTAWAAYEDEARRAPMPAHEVAQVLPDLLRLAEAIPRKPAAELTFPPIAGGPRAASS